MAIRVEKRWTGKKCKHGKEKEKKKSIWPTTNYKKYQSEKVKKVDISSTVVSSYSVVEIGGGKILCLEDTKKCKPMKVYMYIHVASIQHFIPPGTCKVKI